MRGTPPPTSLFFLTTCATRLVASQPIPAGRHWLPRADGDGGGITNKIAGYGEHVCSTCSPATQAAIVVGAVLGFLLLIYFIYRWRRRKNQAARDAVKQRENKAKEQETVEAAHVKRNVEARARAADAVDMVNAILKGGEGPSSNKP